LRYKNGHPLKNTLNIASKNWGIWSNLNCKPLSMIYYHYA
jgi:hypothetical protein